MYVCMYVCVYGVCMYDCMYIRMYICIYDYMYVCDCMYRVQNNEWTVLGQMAKYFNKCLAIYKSIWPIYIICVIK